VCTRNHLLLLNYLLGHGNGSRHYRRRLCGYNVILVQLVTLPLFLLLIIKRRGERRLTTSRGL